MSVPNTTGKKLVYHVTSDLPFVTGKRTVTVLAGDTGTYEIVVSPKKRGLYTGILTLIAGKNTEV